MHFLDLQQMDRWLNNCDNNVQLWIGSSCVPVTRMLDLTQSFKCLKGNGRVNMVPLQAFSELYTGILAVYIPSLTSLTIFSMLN